MLFEPTAKRGTVDLLLPLGGCLSHNEFQYRQGFCCWNAVVELCTSGVRYFLAGRVSEPVTPFHDLLSIVDAVYNLWIRHLFTHHPQPTVVPRFLDCEFYCTSYEIRCNHVIRFYLHRFQGVCS